MGSILDDMNSPAKILLIGKSGAGKTGALASLVTEGYNLRIVDTDKGIRTLRSLLTDVRYPYAKLIKARNIDLNMAVRYISIDTAMKLRTITTKIGEGRSTSQTLLAPADAKAWPQVVGLLDGWKEPDLDLGPVNTWGLQDVLVLDSFSTLAKCAYYFSQAMNGRLGSRDQGYDYQRDVGEAQSQLTRLLELLYDSRIGCNVIVISHITWVDESQGVAARPREATKEGNMIISNPDGYPSAIGRALSPHMGKYFNDAYIARSEGSGMSVRRSISTVPQDGVLAKNSVFLDREYPTTTGLASIFAAIRSQPVPQELIDAHKPRAQAPLASGQSVGQRTPTAVVA
jgi:AAA domain